MTQKSKTWAEVNAIYQIYPRSFQDSNGDGVGDLRGVIQRLGYLKGDERALGVDAIWFSPFFKSPMADFGYDVSDYCDIHPLFGTLEDFKELIAEAHARDIKVMIDFVPNHSSDEHPWFLESKASRENPKRNYYTWADPKPDGSPPNNWLSIFGGSAWEWDESTSQYYLHTFLKEQPDLNWENPAVRKEMQDILRFWFELGVDGIRADAVRWISKDQHLRDDPRNVHYKGGDGADEFGSLFHVNSRFGPHLFDYLREMTDIVEQYPDRIMIFEDYPDEVFTIRDQYLGFYSINPKVSMPFNFEGIGIPFGANNYRRFITEFQGFLNQKEHTPVYCFGNHDQHRLVTRVGAEQARVVAVMQLGLPGLPVVYYGDELGMANGIIKPEEEQDPLNKIKPGLNQGRDPERTPMQWDASEHAGFSAAKPWLPLAASAGTNTVAREQADPDSYLALYQSLLKLRDTYNIFRLGDYETYGPDDEHIFIYGRRLGDQHAFVALNMSKKKQTFKPPHGGRLLAASHPGKSPKRGRDGSFKLRPYEAIIVECAEHPLKQSL
ncbi:alpha-amylase [Candidatus Saccharibacteria bacterium]|nr:alpha-amylase [Candidatus Saccharibacteria bacterium]